jgi:gluconolactonase
VRIEKDGSRTTLADRFEGKRFGGPNDVAVRQDGSVYFTDTFGGMLKADKDPSKELPSVGIYMVREGRVSLLINDIASPNGLAFSPDERVFYANGGRQRFIRRYDVKPDGTLQNPSVLIDLNAEKAPGITDGMKTDRDGNIWTTGPGGVWVISPAGKPLGRIAVPELAANLTFGGPDGKTLFIAARTSIYAMRVNASGR